ncbi:4Fe-4S binding protein [Maridesulfovibrio sp.]|uniref:4Fe-4S binding protein n=1 Tax=unclassified Maridesulfovibrio TaxID=2794999 RepID=UPI003AFF7312
MTLKEITEAAEKIGCLSMTTLEGETMHSRIVSLCGGDDEGLYFLTMDVKPFFRQLKANPQISICGIYPTSRKEGKNKDGQPYFPPGYTLRITGEAREVPMDELREKAAAGSPIHEYVREDHARYPSIRLFCIYKGKGEIFDFDFEMEHRDHKLLRTRFAFGGGEFNDAGVRIDPDKCVRCGECMAACTFKAIESEDGYRVNGSRCDECGSCIQVCPAEAIDFSLTI